MYPNLNPDEEENFYASEFEEFMDSRSQRQAGWSRVEEHIQANEATRLRRMKYLTKYLEGRKDLLEFGCSSGFMLFPLEENHVCTGIEPSGVFSEFLKSKGVNAYRSREELINHSKNKYDLIMHFFVLEHIVDPLLFLREQLEMLKPGGKIIFEVPSASDPLYAIYDIPEFERFYWSIAHPWYFSFKSLTYLLEKLEAKFEIFGDQRYDLSNHMTWALKGRPGGMNRFTKLLGPDLEESYKADLIKNKNCDTLVAVIST